MAWMRGVTALVFFLFLAAQAFRDEENGETAKRVLSRYQSQLTFSKDKLKLVAIAFGLRLADASSRTRLPFGLNPVGDAGPVDSPSMSNERTFAEPLDSGINNLPSHHSQGIAFVNSPESNAHWEAVWEAARNSKTAAWNKYMMALKKYNSEEEKKQQDQLALQEALKEYEEALEEYKSEEAGEAFAPDLDSLSISYEEAVKVTLEKLNSFGEAPTEALQTESSMEAFEGPGAHKEAEEALNSKDEAWRSYEKALKDYLKQRDAHRLLESPEGQGASVPFNMKDEKALHDAEMEYQKALKAAVEAAKLAAGVADEGTVIENLDEHLEQMYLHALLEVAAECDEASEAYKADPKYRASDAEAKYMAANTKERITEQVLVRFLVSETAMFGHA